MTISPHPAPPGHELQPPRTSSHRAGRHRTGRSRPWYKRARYLVPLVAAMIAAALVGGHLRGTTTTHPERGTGTAATPSSPYDEAFGTFDPVTVSGIGTDTVTLPASLSSEARSGLLTISFAGSGRFEVALESGPPIVRIERGGRTGGTVPLSGPYRGTILFGDTFMPVAANGSRSADDPWRLRIWTAADSNAPWQATFAPISSARELPGATGAGDDVLLYNGDFARLHLRHRPAGGTGSLGVAQWALDRSDGDLPRVGQLYLYPGPAVVAVYSSGGWSATVG